MWHTLGGKKPQTKNYSKPADHTWSVFSISPQAQNLHTFLLEIAQHGEKQLHTTSSYFPKAISIGISYRIRTDVIPSILVKPALAELILDWCPLVLRFEEKGKHSFFLADVTVKTWNPEDVGPTTITSGCKVAFRVSLPQTPMTANYMLALEVHQTLKLQ